MVLKGKGGEGFGVLNCKSLFRKILTLVEQRMNWKQCLCRVALIPVLQTGKPEQLKAGKLFKEATVVIQGLASRGGRKDGKAFVKNGRNLETVHTAQGFSPRDWEDGGISDRRAVRNRNVTLIELECCWNIAWR
jgi:hypothetical protein